MSESKSPRDQAVELLVYAPIGLALEVRELVPRLVERGRGQVVLAQLIGRVAAERGRAEVTRNISRLVPTPSANGNGNGRAANGSSPTVRAVPDQPPAAVTADLAAVEAVLPGYEDLPAADVVRELDDLDAEQLEVVRRYEQQHRRRITILNKIDRIRQG